MYAASLLPRLGYDKRAHLMNPMVPGLSGGKMSSSEPKSKIDFLDSAAEVKSKLKAAVCTPGDVENNGVLAFVKAVLIPVQELKEEQAKSRGEKQAPRGEGSGSFVSANAPQGTVFSLPRPEKFGGDIHFSSYQALEDAYAKEEVHPGDLKGGVTHAMIELLTPIRKMFDADKEWQEAERNGYPDQSVQSAASAKPAAAKVDKVSHLSRAQSFWRLR
jgi:tyrosyl-tRNA synthetase